MTYDVLIVGGGIAGLTAAAYLSKEGKKVLVCEKQDILGGLVSSFEYKGYIFDGGIRAIENSGIVMPMLRQLGIEIPFIRSIVSVGVENEIMKVSKNEDIETYSNLLKNQFPNNKKDVDKIIKEIKKIMKYMDVLYGIDNPLFMDIKNDRKYLFRTLLPWLVKYLFTIGKINRLKKPVEDYIRGLTENQVLNDIITQHFFKQTPTFFALSYFSLYLDYQYPKAGTGMIIQEIEKYIKANNGEVSLNTEITSIKCDKLLAHDSAGNTYKYKNLLWAADLNKLYSIVDLETIKDSNVKQKTIEYKEKIINLKGGDSVQTVFAMVDLKPDYFKSICTGHFFYTPKKIGLFDILKRKDDVIKSANKEIMLEWAKEYLEATTYEISIPALRNESLAPKGKTGLIISTLMDYDFIKKIEEMGWYDLYKKETSNLIIEILTKSVFADLRENIIETFSSTPLTIEKLTANKMGAITGWAFTNNEMPVVHRMTKVAKSVYTTIPNIYQAGQWSYSPSGLPISILTGKLAVDEIIKNNMKRKR